MNNKYLALSIGVIFVLLVAILFSISNKPTVSTTLSSFKQEYEKAFIPGCVQAAGGSTFTSYCTCVANYMVNNYTESELTNFSVEYARTGVLPTELISVAGSCLK